MEALSYLRKEMPSLYTKQILHSSQRFCLTKNLSEDLKSLYYLRSFQATILEIIQNKWHPTSIRRASVSVARRCHAALLYSDVSFIGTHILRARENLSSQRGNAAGHTGRNPPRARAR